MTSDPGIAAPLTAPMARGTRGAVVAPHHLATAAGLSLLEQGGSAVDAAIATNAALGVVAPYHCGFGGDAFWLVWDADRAAIEAIGGAGRAPRKVNPDRLRAAGLRRMPVRGPLPITVPAAVRSWRVAHGRHGRLPIAAVLEPSRTLAADGFPASARFAAKVESVWTEISSEPWAAGFGAVYRAADRPWRAGEVVRQPALARTIARLAESGLDDLYEGETGATLAAALSAAGSPIEAADLEAQDATLGAPLVGAYRGVGVATHPLPSSGVLALLILAILERHAPPARDSFGPAGWTDPAWIHLAMEAAAAALIEREALLGDPEVVGPREADLLDAVSIAGLAAGIDPARARTGIPPLTRLVAGTAYVAAVDEWGGAVSLITSNATDFGSAVVDPATGIAFHNRGQGFSLDAAHPNALAPRRRPMHSLLPAMLLRNGRPWIVVGSMGGDAQPQVLAHVTSAVVDGGAEIGAAIAAPRWSVEPSEGSGPPIETAVEAATPVALERGLAGLGHAIARLPSGEGIGHAHAIEMTAEGLRAVTDPRSEGAPAVR
jgi:gamma-glutamyltranspeptidase/glutathione hydrolase